eukprot:CAMPEP_0170461964 /NCGR_PEP_ID=MMETSP0123-20130129/7659_1 /TAXON_ID=182087 /ORGANISM="Favella ehrenbergii, Strain Fehren 1" /LENGTH=54 /DNA_ID=CAMNT_0010727089 /DNA_START=635 /DNA_END=799 /DNA_ORIENTATION=+
MSAAALAGADSFPQPPSHYLGQGQPMMMSEAEIEALHHGGEPGDSVGMAMQLEE